MELKNKTINFEIDKTIIPIGTIISVAKNLSASILIDDVWEICDGHNIINVNSIKFGTPTPNLIGKLLKGNSSSGATGGRTSHNHGGYSSVYSSAVITTSNGAGLRPNHSHTIGTGDILPLSYNVIFYIKVA